MDPSDNTKTCVQFIVLHAFEPFTISPVLKVKLDRSTASTPPLSLPDMIIFKVFDRIFAHDFRAWFDAAELTQGFEEQFRFFLTSGAANKSLDEWQTERKTAHKSRKEHPPLETEAFLRTLLSSYHDNATIPTNVYLHIKGIISRSFTTELNSFLS